MITGEKKLLRAWALFLPGGIRLQGAHEYTPPAINITTVDMAAPDLTSHWRRYWKPIPDWLILVRSIRREWKSCCRTGCMNRRKRRRFSYGTE